jgi:hypothetical protein
MKLDYKFQNGFIYVSRSGLYNSDGTVCPWMMIPSSQLNALRSMTTKSTGAPKGFAQYLQDEITRRFTDNPDLGELVISRGEDGLNWCGVDIIDCGL